MDIIECLVKIGFTRQESSLYLTLCKEGELTGYEAAKISGIPRSNAYLALAGLVEKGGAYKIESERAKYSAVPVKEFAANSRRRFEDIVNYIEKNTPEKNTGIDPYISVCGKNHIIDKMKNIINNAENRLYMSSSREELEFVRDEIYQAEKRELKIVIVTSGDFQLQHGVVYYNKKSPGQIRLIADSSQVLTGEINGESSSTCLYSRNKNLVELIKDSLTNEIELIQMKDK